MIFSMVSTSESKTPLGKGAVLHLDLNGQISERVTENPFQELLGQQSLQEQGLDQILTAIKVAKDNDNIAGIYIESGVCATDFASLEEIRKALLDFKSSKKFILAYGENYTQAGYYLASVADKIVLNPSGMLDWHGIASQPIFFKELMEKLAGLPPDMPVMYDDKTTCGLDLAAVSEVCIGLDDENLEVLVIHAEGGHPGATLDEIDHVAAHQANYRILDTAAARLGMPIEKFYLNVLQFHGQNSFSDCLMEFYQERIARVICGQTTDEASASARLIARFYAHALVGVLLDWASAGMQQDPRPFVKMLDELLSGRATARELSARPFPEGESTGTLC